MFEKRFLSQEFYDNRTIEETLDIGWELFSGLPRTELKRLAPEFIEKYGRKDKDNGGGKNE